MIIAHLIGGNEIKGFKIGKVIVNNKELPCSYEQLGDICGNISLGDLDTEQSYNRMVSDYTELANEFLCEDESIDESFVEDNMLMYHVSYSEYELDLENKTLTLVIQAYES